MSDGAWAATSTAALAFFGGLFAFLRRRTAPKEHGWQGEIATLRHDAAIQTATLTRIEAILVGADLPSLQQQMARHAGRLDRIERHLEEQS